MKSKIPFFRIPLNVPHAATLSGRVQYHFMRIHEKGDPPESLVQLVMLLHPYRGINEDPPAEEGKDVAETAAKLGREIVNEIERRGGGDDRLGQTIRNLFECLGMGEEGAILSLRAGENPDSALRPR